MKQDLLKQMPDFFEKEIEFKQTSMLELLIYYQEKIDNSKAS